MNHNPHVLLIKTFLLLLLLLFILQENNYLTEPIRVGAYEFTILNTHQNTCLYIYAMCI